QRAAGMEAGRSAGFSPASGHDDARRFQGEDAFQHYQELGRAPSPLSGRRTSLAYGTRVRANASASTTSEPSTATMTAQKNTTGSNQVAVRNGMTTSPNTMSLSTHAPSTIPKKIGCVRA